MITAINQLAILTFDDAWLALPLSEVIAIERTAGVRYGEVQGRSLGSLMRAGRHYAVYGLSPKLRLLSELPARRLFCACLAGEEGQAGMAVACDTAMPINLGQDTVLQPLPECMQRTGTPLRHLLKRQQRLVSVSTAAALTDYIKSLEEKSNEQAQ